MPGEPRYVTMRPPRPGGGAHVWRCLDCGSMGLAEDQAAHTRFHSILSAHAWALAVLENSHISPRVHDRYDAKERIRSKRFDSWSADALAEVIASHDDST